MKNKPSRKIEVIKGQKEEFNCNEWLTSLIALEVEQLQIKQCQCLSDAYYLYFKHGAIKISKERNRRVYYCITCQNINSKDQRANRAMVL